MEFSQDIHDEISLASKKAQDQESKLSKLQAMELGESSRYRASGKHFRNQLTREQLEAKQQAACKLSHLEFLQRYFWHEAYSAC